MPNRTAQKERLEAVLEQENYNIRATARRLGVHRNTVHNRMRKYGIVRQTPRPPYELPPIPETYKGLSAAEVESRAWAYVARELDSGETTELGHKYFNTLMKLEGDRIRANSAPEEEGEEPSDDAVAAMLAKVQERREGRH